MKQPNETERRKFKQFEGITALYKEPPSWGIVRLDRVEPSDWGISIKLQTLHTQQTHPLPKEFIVSSSWDTFTGDNEIWHANYVNWTFFFHIHPEYYYKKWKKNQNIVIYVDDATFHQ